MEADAFPVLWLAFSSETLSTLQINDLVNRIARPRLQTVAGVADVPIYGERRYAMRVWLDREPDWTEVGELMRDSYRLIAPKKLQAILDAGGER